MVYEYSVAYQYESEEDLALLSNDLLFFLEGLLDAENFKSTREKMDEGVFEQFLVAELSTADALPESIAETLTELVKSVKFGTTKLSEVDGVFGVRRARAAYQASYMQALYCLLGHVYDLNPNKPEPKPYEPVLTLIKQPYYYTPFVKAA